MVAGLLAAWILDHHHFLAYLAGAACGYGTFVAVELIYRRLRNADGLGRGDAKLLGAIGAWVGWQALPSVVLVAASTAVIMILGVAWTRRQPLTATTSVAFGPFLAAGAWLVWLYGPLTL